MPETLTDNKRGIHSPAFWTVMGWVTAAADQLDHRFSHRERYKVTHAFLMHLRDEHIDPLTYKDPTGHEAVRLVMDWMTRQMEAGR